MLQFSKKKRKRTNSEGEDLDLEKTPPPSPTDDELGKSSFSAISNEPNLNVNFARKKSKKNMINMIMNLKKFLIITN